MSARIPATVVTGFLGAGKTTLIQHLLRSAGGRRLALVINEFGSVGVDGEILQGCGIEGCAAENIIELANGCICCTVADDFLPTMQALVERPVPPEHIVIETSGLALPKPLVQAFAWPEVRTRVTVDGVVAVIDGPAVAAGRFADDPVALAHQRSGDPALDHDSPLAELFEDQLACADLVVLNKIDLMDAAARAEAERIIAAGLRPGVKVVPARFGAADAAVLLGLGAAAEDDLAARPSHHDGEASHDHDDFESLAVALPAVPSPQALAARLAPVVARPDVLRVKGFAAVDGKPMRLVIQGVGARLQHHFDRPWAPGEPREGRLVVIGLKGLDRGAITAAVAPSHALEGRGP
ncbi:MAG: cobalamin biosynthesis protein CobW [Rhodospirillaceae bacterium]|nr:cobalamin biosynthesis protein CobW [Rhodospirillaceae bacterium]